MEKNRATFIDRVKKREKKFLPSLDHNGNGNSPLSFVDCEMQLHISTDNEHLPIIIGLEKSATNIYLG